MSSRHEWVDMETDAELQTFTRVVVMPTSFSGHEPYTVGIGKLKNGLKVLAWVESPPENLQVGDRLTLEARKAPNGAPYYVFVTRKG
jgi:uncharacterized OB-fold protein